MHDLKCRTARLWLQAPDDLGLLDARHLERHLRECPNCDAYRREQVLMDDRIRLSLNAAVGTVSVREQVRARLAEPADASRPVAPYRPQKFGGGLAGGWRRLLPAAILTPVAAIGVALALILPSILSGGHSGLTPTSAGWHLQRPSVGYPPAVDATRPNHLIAGALGEVYQSWDAGNTWQQLAPLPGQFVVRDVAIDYSDPNRYIVATDHSILVSEDAGKHWTTTAKGLLGAYITFLLQDPRNPSVFYAGPSVLWKSTDHAHTWRMAGPGYVFATGGVLALAFAPNGDLYTGITGGGTAVSHNGGQTWVRRARGLPLPRTVLSVAIGKQGRLWAAAWKGGIYVSTDGALSWAHAGPRFHFFATSVFAQGSYVLVGGNGAVLRSTDDGAHWHVSTKGLPLDPYVYGFVADPRNSNRVYASLDGDGVFRSDDGGRTWQGAQAGLPPATTDNPTVPVLFKRNGTLWKTDGLGDDPGNLTVDADIRAAALSPDAAAVAYLTGTGTGWAARVVGAGGSSATTITSGAGAVPAQLFWSPDASTVAVVDGSDIALGNQSGKHARWSFPSGQLVLGWYADGKSLLFWDSANDLVTARTWQTGGVSFTEPGIYGTPPVPAPDGKQIALLSGGSILTGTWQGGVHPVASVPAGCSLSSWSGDSSRILLTCVGHAEELTAGGMVTVQPAGVPHTAFWAPGSNTDLLFFRNGSLWRWSAPGTISHLVSNAHGVRSQTAAGLAQASGLGTPCQAADLSGSITSLQAASRALAGNILLQNQGKVACVLRGYPAVQLADAGGQPLPLTRGHLTSNTAAGGTPMRSVILAPGARSRVTVIWVNWCQGTPIIPGGAQYPITGPLKVTLALPGGGNIPVTWRGKQTASSAEPRCTGGPGTPSTLTIGPFTTPK